MPRIAPSTGPAIQACDGEDWFARVSEEADCGEGTGGDVLRIEVDVGTEVEGDVGDEIEREVEVDVRCLELDVLSFSFSILIVVSLCSFMFYSHV